jgi:hypothetical protein
VPFPILLGGKEMTEQQINPLTEDHLQQINQALTSIDLGLKAAELAKRAEIDVTSQVNSMLDNQKKLRLLKQVYFPGR